MRPSRSRVSVTQGQVAVDMIRLTSKSRNHRAWEISFHSKYPELFGSGGDMFMYGAGEPTLKCDRDLDLTRVTLPIPDGWETFSDHYGKWTMTVVAYRPRRRRLGVLFTDRETGDQPRYNRHGETCSVCGGDLSLVFKKHPGMVEDEHANRFIHTVPDQDHIPVLAAREDGS